MVPDFHEEKCSGSFKDTVIDTDSLYGWTSGSENRPCFGYDIDASRSSSVYGNSTTVQPATCKCYFCIKY